MNLPFLVKIKGRQSIFFPERFYSRKTVADLCEVFDGVLGRVSPVEQGGKPGFLVEVPGELPGGIGEVLNTAFELSGCARK